MYNVLHIKRLLYHQRCSFSGTELHASYNWRVTVPKKRMTRFLTWHFVHTCMHDSTVTGHRWMFYYQRYLYCGVELHMSYMYDCWVMSPKMHHSLMDVLHRGGNNSRSSVICRAGAQGRARSGMAHPNSSLSIIIVLFCCVALQRCLIV